MTHLLDIAQVADLLRISRRTAWRLLSRGVLPPPIRLSRRVVRWRANDIERLLAEPKDRRTW